MKIIDKITRAQEEGRPFWSFEYFPPKTTAGVQNLFERMERMYNLGPEFIDITWNAGGTSSDLTSELVATAQSVYGLETCMHLTCTNMPKEKIDIALKAAKACGNQNILALRGDPPRGVENWEACDNGFSYASDLVAYIREQYGDYFSIGVAGYPERHLDSTSKEDDFKWLKHKVDQGADFIVTQLFYDSSLFIQWVKECREYGITVPILPGIMPIQSFGGFTRMTTLCKTFIPEHVKNALEPIKEDDQAVKDYGVKLAIQMCKEIQAAGINGFHYYTLNLEKSTRLILEGLQFVAARSNVRQLPWNPSLSKKREKENVRPIFWKNRIKSYVTRTEAWDEFPNGRWGDSRSPAYGELDGYGATLKLTAKEALQIWGHPETPQDVADLFARYCKGEVKSIPWCDERSLSPETAEIRDELEKLNRRGYLTINSQPAVNGVRSDDKVHGWGPKNGYVYQKAYLEFFVSPDNLSELVNRIEEEGQITYYAVNRRGDLRTNSQNDGPNAVTWGVFVGKEIVQPTVVEVVSFMAWKDEAFELWNQWSKIYESSSPSAKVINTIRDEWFLINIVHNDFQNHEGLFRVLDSVKTANGSALVANGHS
ncbi:MAG: methylenetetrahydrofolate reductase-domain-containing protein [Benniella sp.]|nr:MAG: methylenetetrahydrofolate reductase-domain-containing protein [Benniella sp.]